MRLHNVSIHINFCLNRFINECARKKVYYNISWFNNFVSTYFLWDVEELTSSLSGWGFRVVTFNYLNAAYPRYWEKNTNVIVFLLGFVGSSNKVESLIYDDFLTLKERCYSKWLSILLIWLLFKVFYLLITFNNAILSHFHSF